MIKKYTNRHSNENREIIMFVRRPIINSRDDSLQSITHAFIYIYIYRIKKNY